MNKVIIQKPFAGFLLKSFRTKLDGVDVQNKGEARADCEARRVFASRAQVVFAALAGVSSSLFILLARRARCNERVSKNS